MSGYSGGRRVEAENWRVTNRKTPVTAAELLNDRVLPFYEAHDIRQLRVLTDRGTELSSRTEVNIVA